MTRQRKNRQSGFGAIAAIVVLVLLAVLAAGIVSISTTQSMTVAQDILSARANQSARAGVEWGVYQAIKVATWQSGGTCDAGAQSQSLDLSATNGTPVTVSCSSQQFNEGETCPGGVCNAQTVRVYTVTAIASQGASSTAPGYVERRRQTIVVR